MTDNDKESAPQEAPDLNSNNPNQTPPWFGRSPNASRGKSLGVKFFLLGVLALMLCIPLFMVWGLVKEREANYRRTTAEIGRQWGADQTINGPFLAVPVIQQWTEEKDGKNIVRRQAREVLVAPDHLALEADAETTKRQRGIHEAIVYQSQMNIRAEFSRPDLISLSSQIVRTDWTRARLVLSMSDMKGIVDISVQRDGKNIAEVEPGLGLNTQMTDNYAQSGLHVPLNLNDDPGSWTSSAPNSAKNLVFDLAMTFKGSQTMSFVPVGESTKVTLESSWPHPSFSGSFLPTEREVSEAGFTAHWMVSKLARSIPHLSFVNTHSFGHYDSNGFGVRFYQPVDFYRLVDRAVKYGVLFVGMAFLIIFAVEILSKGRMHAVHYTMSGMMVVMFYVLLLALAEVMGFSLAYGVAAGATGAVLAGFVASFFKGRQASVGAVAGFSILYGFLYLVLRLEDVALLAGAVTGFVILTVMMFATRNVDWSGRNQTTQPNLAPTD